MFCLNCQLYNGAGNKHTVVIIVFFVDLQHSRSQRVRMGEPAQILLGERMRRAVDPPVHRKFWLRLRVYGSEWTFGHNSID